MLVYRLPGPDDHRFGPADNLAGFGQEPRALRDERHPGDTPAGARDRGFAAQHPAILEFRDERYDLARRRKDGSIARRRPARRFRPRAGNRSSRRQAPSARDYRACDRSARRRRRTDTGRFGNERVVVRQRREAVADVPRRNDVELGAQLPRAPAVVGCRHDRDEAIARRELACTRPPVEQRPQSAKHVRAARSRRRARRSRGSAAVAAPSGPARPTGRHHVGLMTRRQRRGPCGAAVAAAAPLGCPPLGPAVPRAASTRRSVRASMSGSTSRTARCSLPGNRFRSTGNPRVPIACSGRVLANSANARGAQSRTPPASIRRSMMSTSAAAPSAPNFTIPRFSPSASAGSMVFDMSSTRPQRTLTFISSSPNSG